MICQKILVPTDFSPASEIALSLASALASQCNAELIIAHVDEPPAAMVMTEQFGAPIYLDTRVQERLRAVVPPDDAVRFQHRLLRGVAADEIVKLSEAEQVDLILIGTHGRGRLSRLLLGSVAEAVLHQAKCPVLLAKPSEAT